MVGETSTAGSRTLTVTEIIMVKTMASCVQKEEERPW